MVQSSGHLCYTVVHFCVTVYYDFDFVTFFETLAFASKLWILMYCFTSHLHRLNSHTNSVYLIIIRYYYPSYNDVCFVYPNRLLWIPLIWRGPKWTSRGFLSPTLKLTLRGSPRRRNCLTLWRKLVRTVTCEKVWLLFSFNAFCFVMFVILSW